VNEFPDALTDSASTRSRHAAAADHPALLVLAPIFAVVLQATPIGRRIYALGGSPAAARYAGVPPSVSASRCSWPRA